MEPPPSPRHSDSPDLPAPSQEIVLWEGTPSGWQLCGWWLSCLLILPIPWVCWKWLVLKNERIVLTSQRLRLSSGVFTKAHEDIELYRVKDWTVTEPFCQRMMGCGSLTALTSDRTAPEVALQWLPGVKAFSESLRQAVEAVRERKRVREVDFTDEDTLT